MGRISVLFPMNNGGEIWLWFDTSGFRLRFFGTVTKKLVNSEHLVAE
jgi:hypothetical protein